MSIYFVIFIHNSDVILSWNTFLSFLQLFMTIFVKYVSKIATFV